MALKLALATVTLLALPSLACKVITPPENLNFFASYERGITNFYGKSNYTEVNSCGGNRSSRNKYFMIAVGPDHLTENYGLMNSYTGQLGDDYCHITNHKFSHYNTFAEKNKYYREKAHLIYSCVRTVVEDLANPRIEYPVDQKNCTITRVSDQRVILSGGACFLTPNSRTTYRMMHYVIPECAKRDYLVKHGINPKDVFTGINFFKAGDYSGDSTELDFLGSARARISIDPGSELMPIRDELSETTPRWPTTWAPDVHIANLSAVKVGEQSTQFDLSYLVDNTCKEICVKGLCSSPCDFSIPIVGEVTLSELRGTKKELMDSWYHGGVVLPRWQGIMKPVSKYLDHTFFEIGHTYEAEVVFRDPYDDYSALLNKISQYLVDLAGIQSGTPGISTIPSLPGLHDLPRLPEMPKLPGLGGENSTDSSITDLDQRLQNLMRYLGVVEWPPFYDKFCSANLEACKKTQNMMNIKLKITFDAVSIKGDQVEFGNLRVSRESPILKSYKDSKFQPMEFVCEMPPEALP